MFVKVVSVKLLKMSAGFWKNINLHNWPCIAQQSFFFFSVSFSQASQPDELTIDEHEMLEVIEDGDMEDWVKVNQSYLGYFSSFTPPAEVYFLSKNQYDCNSRRCTE